MYAAKQKKEHDQTGIPVQMKEQFEQASGLSFDDVRVHYASEKPAQLQALAYTQGTDVYVAPGQERHLPHELGHVVQQKKGSVAATETVGGMGVNSDPALERGADTLARQAGQPVQAKRTQGVVQKYGLGEISSGFYNLSVGIGAGFEVFNIFNEWRRSSKANNEARETELYKLIDEIEVENESFTTKIGDEKMKHAKKIIRLGRQFKSKDKRHSGDKEPEITTPGAARAAGTAGGAAARGVTDENSSAAKEYKKARGTTYAIIRAAAEYVQRLADPATGPAADPARSRSSSHRSRQRNRPRRRSFDSADDSSSGSDSDSSSGSSSDSDSSSSSSFDSDSADMARSPPGSGPAGIPDGTTRQRFESEYETNG